MHSLDMTDHFESPKLLVERARDHIRDLDLRISAFFDRKPYARVVDFDRETGQDVYKVSLTAMLPGSLAVVMKDITSNLRDALDHAVFGACVALGNPSPKETQFPFADNGVKFDGMIWALKEVPPDIRTLLESFRPYPQGNEPLWALNKLRNQKTHKMLVPLGVASTENSIGLGRFKIVPPAQMGYSRWDAAKNELEYMRLGRGSQGHYELTVTFQVTIGDFPAIGGQPAVATLHTLAGEVERIVLAIESETARIRGFT